MRNTNLADTLRRFWRGLSPVGHGILLFLMDAALIGIGLCIFALFHHVLPRKEQAIGITSSREAMRGAVSAEATVQPNEAEATASEMLFTAAPSDGAVTDPVTTDISASEPLTAETDQPAVQPAATSADAALPVAQTDPIGHFGSRFADKFTQNGKVISTTLDDGTVVYQSENLNVSMQRFKDTEITGRNLVYYVVDFYIKDISCLRTALANDTYGKGQRQWVREMARNNDAIAAINGDFYSARSEGSVIRNGVLYREKTGDDLCVLYWDGTMKTFGPVETTATEEIEKGAYQLWSFGPRMLDDNGHALSQFNTSVPAANPRTAIGYFEPGHYCFVVVDGRTDTSHGIKISQLAALMESLGCKQAYNLDGGQTSVLVWGDEVASKPVDGGRTCSDIVMIGEPTD